MATVWANFNGTNPDHPDLRVLNVVEDAGHGWSHVKNFSTLAQLTQWVREAELHGQIQHLNLHCHGGPGELYLDHTVRAGNADRRLGALEVYFASNAKLVFTGCNSGYGVPGTRLLVSVSEAIRNSKIIAFDDPHWIEPGFNQYEAGKVFHGHGAVVTPTTRRVSVLPWDLQSKWARIGRILKYPVNEQSNRPNMACAYPYCPGHGMPDHQCDGGWDPGCEWRGRVPTEPLERQPDEYDILWETIRNSTPPHWNPPRNDQTPRRGGKAVRPGPLGLRMKPD